MQIENNYESDYTEEEIEEVLNEIKKCILNNDYRVLGTRDKNAEFINEYNLKSYKQKELLLQIQVKDFCYTMKSKKEGFEGNLLYVFTPKVDLFDATGEKENVSVYTKFDLLKVKLGKKVVVISLHKLEKPIEYKFV